MEFRALAVRECAAALPWPGAKWPDIVDAAVYKGSGLRMIGSRKFKAPPYVYLPTYEVDADGVVSPISHPWASISDWVRLTSIREVPGAAASSASLSPSSSTPSPATTLSLEDKLDEGDHVAILQRQCAGKGEGLDNLRMTPALRGILETHRINFPYDKARITSVYHIKGRGKGGSGGKGAVYVLASDSKRCLNLVSTKNRGNHHSNHVYFVLNETGLYQRCFCQCETAANRLDGPCKRFNKHIQPFRGVYKALHEKLTEYARTCGRA
jgi:hypothetical protein